MKVFQIYLNNFPIHLYFKMEAAVKNPENIAPEIPGKVTSCPDK